MIALTSATEAKKVAAQNARSKISKISLGGGSVMKGLDGRRSTIQSDQANDIYEEENSRDKDALGIENGNYSKHDRSFAEIYGKNDDDTTLQISVKNDFNLKQNENML
jgi:hypothetical protein